MPKPRDNWSSVEPRNRAPGAAKSPLAGSDICPKWPPKASPEASGRALDSWVPRPVLERFWGTFLAFKIVQNRLQNEPEIEHRFGTIFLSSGSRRGSSLGLFWGPSGGHFGVDFCPPGAISDFSKKRARASAGARFSGPQWSKKQPKVSPKTEPEIACRTMPAPRPSLEPLGRLLGSMLNHFWSPETAPEPFQKQPQF